MENLSQAIRAERLKLAQVGGFFWIFEFSPSPAEIERFTNNNEDIEFPTGSGKIFGQFPFRVVEHRQSGDGNLPSISVDIDNADRSITAILYKHNGFTNQSITLSKVHTDHLASSADATSYTFKAKSVSDAAGVVRIDMGDQDLMDSPIPARTYDLACTWAYKRGACTYAGGISTCDRTLTGENGCLVHFGAAVTLPHGGFEGLK